jgi:phosphoribosylformimino-5-aminoimidazole carboxamide ribotide isomerase
MILIPAIDIIGGECVRLSQGDYAQKKVYFKNPADVAKMYSDNGFKRLHLVDLDGAKESRPVNLRVLEMIKSKCDILVQFGGGVKQQEHLESVFNSGADMVICGSVAAKDSESFKNWIQNYTGERIILGADVKNEKIAVSGWLEETNDNVFDFISKFLDSGLSKVICTDISKDGMLQGPNFELYKKLKNAFPTVKITVSGGISSLSDIETSENEGFDSLILGKALYENRIKMEELKRWLQKG